MDWYRRFLMCGGVFLSERMSLFAISAPLALSILAEIAVTSSRSNERIEPKYVSSFSKWMVPFDPISKLEVSALSYVQEALSLLFLHPSFSNGRGTYITTDFPFLSAVPVCILMPAGSQLWN